MNRTFILREPQHAASLSAFIAANWEAMADKGRFLAVEIKEHKAKRSTDQNKLMWVLLQRIAEAAWIDGKQYSADVWHEAMKRELLGTEELPGGGTVGISTASLNVEEFSQYVTRLQAYAAENLGVEI